jgi:hypothetical protein
MPLKKQVTIFAVAAPKGKMLIIWANQITLHN